MEWTMADPRPESTSSLAARLFTLALFLACFAPFMKCQEPVRPADGRTHPELLVSTQWLSEHLSDPKLVIIDVGMAGMGSMGGTMTKGHIPGTRTLNDDRFASSAPPGTELLPDDQLKANQ